MVLVAETPFVLFVDLQQARTLSHLQTCKTLLRVTSQYIRMHARVQSYQILLGASSAFVQMAWAVRECLRNCTNHKTGLSLWYTMEKNTCPLLSRRKWSAISWESFHRHGNLSSGSELFSFPIIRVTLVSFTAHIGTDARQTGVARTSSDSVTSNIRSMFYMKQFLSCLSSTFLSLVT